MTTENEITPHAADDPGDGPAGAVPGPIVPGDPQADEATARALMRLSQDDLPAAERRRALAEIASVLRQRGFSDFFKPKAAMNWIADTVVDIAPRIPVRDLDTLRQHFPGLTDQQIAG